MLIIFDPDKQQRTLRERGLDFARAAEIFNGKHFTATDDRQDYQEQRYITVGLLDGRMVVMVWTLRDKSRRIISMRKANEREQAHYARRLV
ncbi:BrnT family toxin [Arsukibacterium ikkense]|uniref:BrnT family toxin n=1 Tax=Arsukibacterium ikkense TaxID=336831 RepID=UPI000A04E876|nr:BrnT family toxin [Arsukibacterium ikkense]